MIYWGKVDKSLLMPQFVVDITQLLTDSPYNWYVTEGFRSIERSNTLYAAYKAFIDGKGPPAPRAAPGGRSAHNYGLAVDVALDSDIGKAGLQADWVVHDGGGWPWLRDAIKPHPRLYGGANFGDWPHIERFQWENYKSWQSVLPSQV